jgi:hypothetical protein
MFTGFLTNKILAEVKNISIINIEKREIHIKGAI